MASGLGKVVYKKNLIGLERANYDSGWEHIDRIGDRKAHYGLRGRLTRIGEYEVHYNLLGRITRIGNWEVKRGSLGRINYVGDMEVHYRSGLIRDNNLRIDYIG